jgi:hypothetical protein
MLFTAAEACHSEPQRSGRTLFTAAEVCHSEPQRRGGEASRLASPQELLD